MDKSTAQGIGVKRRRRAGFVAAVAGMALVVAAGCGGSSESSGSATGDATATSGGDSVVQEATKRSEAAAAPISEFTAPGPAFDASKAQGSRPVWFLSISLSLEQQKRIADGLTEALGSVGVDTVIFDTAGTVQKAAAGMEQAIARRASVIILDFPAAAVSAQVAAAKKAGIPVIASERHDPGQVPPDEDLPGIVARVTRSGALPGKWMVDWAVADTDGKLNAVVFYPGDVINVAKPQVDAIKAEVKDLCPDTCKVETVDVPVAAWANRLGSTTSSVLSRNPDVNYLMPVYDGMVPMMLPAVHQAGLADDVKIATYNSSSGPMQSMKDGDVVTANVGMATTWFGWAAADQALRVLSDTEPVDDAVYEKAIPQRLFTRDNVASLDLKNLDETGYGDVDFRAEYKKLWGVQ